MTDLLLLELLCSPTATTDEAKRLDAALRGEQVTVPPDAVRSVPSEPDPWDALTIPHRRWTGPL